MTECNEEKLGTRAEVELDSNGSLADMGYIFVKRTAQGSPIRSAGRRFCAWVRGGSWRE